MEGQGRNPQISFCSNTGPSTSAGVITVLTAHAPSTEDKLKGQMSHGLMKSPPRSGGPEVSCEGQWGYGKGCGPAVKGQTKHFWHVTGNVNIEFLEGAVENTKMTVHYYVEKGGMRKPVYIKEQKEDGGSSQMWGEVCVYLI